MNSTEETSSNGPTRREQPRLATEPELKKVLGKRIAAARRAKKYRQHQMAARMPCHQRTIDAVERGRLLPKRDLIDRFVEVLGISLYELLRAPDPWELS